MNLAKGDPFVWRVGRGDLNNKVKNGFETHSLHYTKVGYELLCRG